MISGHKERLVLVHSARGCVVADALTLSVTTYGNGSPGSPRPGQFPGVRMGPVSTWTAPRREPFVLQHVAMRDALRGLPNDIVTLREGAAAVAATEAMLTSVRTGAPVAVSAAVATCT